MKILKISQKWILFQTGIFPNIYLRKFRYVPFPYIVDRLSVGISLFQDNGVNLIIFCAFGRIILF